MKIDTLVKKIKTAECDACIEAAENALRIVISSHNVDVWKRHKGYMEIKGVFKHTEKVKLRKTRCGNCKGKQK